VRSTQVRAWALDFAVPDEWLIGYLAKRVLDEAFGVSDSTKGGVTCFQ
jgi:hypothetical protein